MRRFVLGFLLAACIAIPAGALGGAAKDAIFGTVTANDFESAPGGGANFGTVNFRGNGQYGVVGINDQDYITLAYNPPAGLDLSISTGYADPTATPCKGARSGSLYLRHNGDGSGGQAWVKTGIDADACGWTKIAG